MENKPRSREKRVTNNSTGVYKRGEGLGTGPVGAGGHSSGSSDGPKRSGGSKSPLAIIIGLIVVMLGGGGGALSMLSGGSDGSTSGGSVATSSAYTSTTSSNNSSSSSSGSSSGSSSNYYSQVLTGWGNSNNTSEGIDTSVASGSRAKYTTIKGNGKDQTTIMVYLCGTDLESKSSMATKDLQEMLKASFDDSINLILYTGGCRKWQNSVMSSSVNQIYQIKGGKLYRLEENMGQKRMTDPATLTEFINYCKKNYPANRNDLILWDHGGGSVSGYGYDEKYSGNTAMSLSGINTALKNAGMKFDFIGFDACLMATAENALMLDDYADYLIASEETEPGIGWYYTDWLTAYGKNPSMSTLEIGKNIVDGFVTECNRSCRGQLTTLSVIDLAEFSNTVPDALNAFATNTTEMIKNDEYQTIAKARGNAREFASSTKIDQVDLVDLAKKINTKESKALADALLSAIKYNRTSSNMTNAYGVSVYFPNRRLAYVDKASQTYQDIGLDDEYSKCIKAFASLEASGQTVSYSSGSGSTGSPFSSLFGEMMSGQTSSSSSSSGSDMTLQILQALLQSGMSSSISGDRMAFLEEGIIDEETTANYIDSHTFDASALKWTEKNGKSVINLSEEQWSLVENLEMNMFYDDGTGYIDLGLDNIFEIDNEGNLICETDKTWLAIDGHPVAYYHTKTVEDGDNYTITGYVPAMVNGVRAQLLLVFDQDEPYGYVSGYVTDYHDGETDTVAKADAELVEGDEVDFLCDFYSYDGEYQDSYYLGETYVVDDDMEISNVNVGDGDTLITYKFTDLFGQTYWTETK